MQARASDEILRKVPGRAQHVPAAHAVADPADGTHARGGLGAEKAEECSGIAHDHVVRQRFERGLQSLARLVVDAIERDHPAVGRAAFEADLARAMVEIRHQAVVADGGDAPRDVEQFLAQPPDVHEDEHRKETVRRVPDG